jgi:hypothetical protein
MDDIMAPGRSCQPSGEFFAALSICSLAVRLIDDRTIYPFENLEKCHENA